MNNLIIVIIIIVTVLIFFIYNIFNISLSLNKTKVKQKINKKINKKFFNRIKIGDLEKYNKPFIFYTDEEWSTKGNSNFLEYPQNNFLILEPGYYYCINSDAIKLHIINKEIDIYIFNFKKYFNLIKYY